ncbi:MAG TPA: tetratricopeptide repeat protein [Syntrophobacteraceae bacterium]|nr:tetratricopeptide repeat protein [Syntrophobacteraceae bacterium]
MKTRALAIVICASALFVLSGCSTNEEKAVKYVARGDRLMQAGDSMRALLEYKNALQLDPKSSAALLAMGKAFLSRKEYPQAYRSLNAALELDPNIDEARVEVATLLCGGQPEKALEEISKIRSPEAFETRIAIAQASAYVVLKQHAKAIELLRKVKDADANVEVQRLLAVSLQEAGDFKGMEEAAIKAQYLEPKAPSAYLFLARFAADHGDGARAAKELDAMVEANGDKAAMLLRAKAFEELRMRDEAENAYEKLPDEPDMLKARAGYYFRQGKNDKAQSLLESILAKAPGDVQATLALVRLFESRGDSASALERIETALKLGIETAGKEKLLLTKASIMADQGDKDAAARICDGVLAQNQGNTDAHLLFGRLMLDAGKFEEAEIHLQQAVSGRPEDAGARVLLARSQFLNKKESMAADTLNAGIRANPSSNDLRLEYLRMLLAKGDLDQAIKILDEGVELQPENLGFLEARGRALASKSLYSKAEQDFLQLVRLAPDSAGGCIEMGRLMLAQSKPEQAIDWLKRALSAKNGWETAIRVLVAAYEQKGDYKGGLAVVESAVAKKDPSPAAFYSIGQVYAGHRNLAEAEKAFNRAVQLAPEWSDPHRAMAIVFAAQGKLDSAIVEMEKMYAISSSPSNALALAMLYEQKGRVDDASRVLDEMLRKSGGSPSAMNDLAYLYAEYRTDPKDLEKAASLAAQALAKQPDNPAFLDTAAWVSFKRNDIDSAWTRIKQALNLQPDAGSLNLHAAVIANTRGDKAEASRYLEKALSENLDAISRKTALDLKKRLEG